MEVDIKCEKCGHVNKSEPESQCTNCGEYLYQFYVKGLNKARYKKIAMLASVISGLIIVFFLFVNAPSKRELSIVDPVKKDLIEYLRQVKNQDDAILRSGAAKNYNRNVEGALDENDERIILAKMGLQKVPEQGEDKYEKYWEEYSKKSKQIVKTSVKERYQIAKRYYETKANYYSQITPITNEVESTHKYLIRSTEFAVKAYDNFVSGISLGYIQNVKDTKDGKIRWTYSVGSKEYSENYKQYIETSDNEEKTYYRLLEQLVLKHDLLAEYKKAYPIQGWLKENSLKKAEVK